MNRHYAAQSSTGFFAGHTRPGFMKRGRYLTSHTDLCGRALPNALVPLVSDGFTDRAQTGVARPNLGCLSFPLKALINDIRKDLETPRSELLAFAAERRLLIPPGCFARHVLVTSPKSVYIMLTAEKSRALHHVETIIFYEDFAIESLAGDVFLLGTTW